MLLNSHALNLLEKIIDIRQRINRLRILQGLNLLEKILKLLWILETVLVGEKLNQLVKLRLISDRGLIQTQ
jgi:hypothetical protein